MSEGTPAFSPRSQDDVLDVRQAFEALLEEIEDVVEDINKYGAERMAEGDYEAVRSCLTDAEKLEDFRSKVRQLQREWDELARGCLSRYPIVRKPGRLPRGLRTPEDEFRLPILEALDELGGSAESQRVLDLVYEKIRDRLNQYDLEVLPSKPNEPRWRNTAAWCRVTLVREGFLRGDSPRGVWELSEKGRQEVARLRGQQRSEPEQWRGDTGTY